MIWPSKSHFRSNPRVPAWENFGRTLELSRDPQESSRRPQESTRRPTEESQEPTSASSRPALPSSNKKVNQLKIDTMKSSENVKGWFGIRKTSSIDLDRSQDLIPDLTYGSPEASYREFHSRQMFVYRFRLSNGSWTSPAASWSSRGPPWSSPGGPLRAQKFSQSSPKLGPSDIESEISMSKSYVLYRSR